MGRTSFMVAPQFSSSRIVRVTPDLRVAVQSPSALYSNRRPFNAGEYPAHRPNVPLYWRGSSLWRCAMARRGLYR